MSFIIPHTLPRLIELGVSVSLTLDVENLAGTQQTATVGTVTIYDGDEVLVNAASATSLGPPAAYTLAAATTSSRQPTAQWLEKWSLTLAGTVYVFQRRGYIVRTLWYPTIDDSDLTARHTELSNSRPSAIDSYQTYRVQAADKIQRDLLKKGRRPWLIFDNYALVDAHVALSLHFLFFDWATNFAQGRFRDLAAHYAEVYEAEMASISFSYDENESGTLDETDKVSAGGPIVFTAGNPAGARWYR